MEKDNLVLFILSGIPGSGKTTWIQQNTWKLYNKYCTPVVVISKDLIRDSLFKSDYNGVERTKEKEKKVSDLFYRQLGLAASFKSAVIIIDNTHCDESRINRYFQIFKNYHSAQKVEYKVVFFNTPFWKAHLRNIIRRLKTGKWISWKAMRAYYNRFKTIDQKKYKHLFPHDL
jgi:predicted kinase